MSKKNQAVLDNYRFDMALKEMQGALRLHHMENKTESKLILISSIPNDTVYLVNGKMLSLTTPILIKHLEMMITQLKEKQNNDSIK